jgi:hypothetical protein
VPSIPLHLVFSGVAEADMRTIYRAVLDREVNPHISPYNSTSAMTLNPKMQALPRIEAFHVDKQDEMCPGKGEQFPLLSGMFMTVTSDTTTKGTHGTVFLFVRCITTGFRSVFATYRLS